MADGVMKRIGDYATNLLKQGKALHAPEDNEAEGFAEKQRQIDEYKKSQQPQTQAAPTTNAPQSVDRVNPMAKYGDRPGEKRPETELTPIGKLPSYQEGGTVPEDQIAKVHEGEEVLNPEDARRFRSEHLNEVGQAPVYPNPKGLSPQGDTEGRIDYDPGYSKMDTHNPPSMNKFGREPQDMNETYPARMRMGNPSAIFPEQKKGEPVISEASAKPVSNEQKPVSGMPQVPNAEIADSAMRPLPGMDQALPPAEAAPNVAMPAQGGMPAMSEVSPATAKYVGDLHDNLMYQRGLIRQDMEKAAAKGDLVGLGTAKLHMLELDRQNPYGSEANHPGLLGKIEHGLAKAGNIAGDILAPGTMMAIPGTELHKGLQAEGARADIAAGTEQNLKEAQEEEARARGPIALKTLEINQQKANETAEKNTNANVIALRKQGLKLDANGNQVPLTYAEMSPQEQATVDLKQSQADAADARGILARYKADPNNAQNKAEMEKVKVMAQNAATAAGKLGLDKAKYVADYFGTDVDGNPLAGAGTDEATGKPIGPKMAKGNEPTSMRLNKADLSQNLQMNAKNVIDKINANPELFGKVAGRYTSVREMAGSNDPAIRELAIDVHNIALASTGIHGLRSAQAVQTTETDILNKFKDSPESTIAGLNDLSGSVQTFIDAAKSGKKVAPTPKSEAEKTAKPAPPKGATNEVYGKDGHTVIGHVVDGKFVKL